MTPREGFKYGFLLRCAEEGLTVEEAEKRAALALEKTGAFDPLGALWGVAQGVPKLTGEALGGGLALAGGASVLGGGLAGYGLAKMQEGDIDPEEIQRQELIDAYNAQSELVRRKAIMEAAQQAQPRPKSFHGI